MEGSQGAVTGGATSPTGSVRPGTAGANYKRKRSGIDFESSPGSVGEVDDEEAERRRQPGVKRACNECRQQKVSHHLMKIANTSCQGCMTILFASDVTDEFIMMHSCDATSFRILSRVVHDAID